MEKPAILLEKAALLRDKARRALRLAAGLQEADQARLRKFSSLLARTRGSAYEDAQLMLGLNEVDVSVQKAFVVPWRITVPVPTGQKNSGSLPIRAPSVESAKELTKAAVARRYRLLDSHVAVSGAVLTLTAAEAARFSL